MIEARDVRFSYARTEVLREVTLRAAPGSVVGLVGPNGSGKTTLLRTLYAALRPAAGTVTIDGDPVHRLRPVELARRVAVVAQESAPDLPVSVVDMVLLGRAPRRSSLTPLRRDDYRHAAAALHRVNARDLADRPFNTLSGGEKQRVLIARALAQEAEHLLLDEPTNHLDLRHQHELLELVRDLGKTCVVVLHDLNLAARYCDHVLLMDRGELVRHGTPREVFTAEVLQPIYAISVERFDDGDCVQLIFRPNSDRLTKDEPDATYSPDPASDDRIAAESDRLRRH